MTFGCGLLALQVAQQRLQAAGDMLAKGGSMEEVIDLVRASSLNCYVYEAGENATLEEKASLFTQARRPGLDG